MVLRKRRKAVRGGFTLMEVLVVVAILVVLAGTGGVIYLRYLEEAYKDRARIDVRTLTQVVETYQVKHGDYPASLAVLTQPQQDGSKPYLEPSALIDPWGREYQYTPQGQHHPNTGKPDIYSMGPKAGDQSGIIGNWSAQQGVGGS
jgi:general secretion pathway protein G